MSSTASPSDYADLLNNNEMIPKFTWNPANQKHEKLCVEVREDRRTSQNSTDSFNIVSNGCDSFRFPPGSCLAKDYVGHEGLDVFRFHYELKLITPPTPKISCGDDCSTGEYSLLSKIITPQHTLRNGVEKHTHAIIDSLLDDTKPIHYERKSELVTERFVMLGSVCIHRQFIWNVNHPESLIRVVDKANSNGCLSLEEELIFSLYSNNPDSKTIPTEDQRPGPTFGIITYDPVDDKHTAFFYPTYKEQILQALWGCGHFLFFPMHHFPPKYFVTHNNRHDQDSQERLKIKICQAYDPNASDNWYSYDSVHDCVHCHQDTCLWKLNSSLILKEINFLCTGEPSCLRTERDRALTAQRMALLLLRLGFGRSYEGKSIPKCILDGCNNL